MNQLLICILLTALYDYHRSLCHAQHHYPDTKEHWLNAKDTDSLLFRHLRYLGADV